MTSDTVDFSEVQGLVRFGYRSLTEASFLLLAIRDVEAARIWLRSAPVSDAVERTVAPTTALQLAFTRDGFERLGLPSELLQNFSAEFLSGLSADESRSRQLGDVGASAPNEWQWGSPGRVPHLTMLVYAQPGHLDDWLATVKGTGWELAFDLLGCLETTDLGGVEPFGFADGISQPELDWARTRRVKGNQLTYSNLVSLGEFLLGYPNEYGRYTERPLLSDDDPLGRNLPHAEDYPDRRDLGRNGCYLVLRTLEQDLHGLWDFLNTRAHTESGVPAATQTSAPDERDVLAESMVGRRRNGAPLVALSVETIPGINSANAAQNQFTYDSDPGGRRCPFGSHIRRANPRNADLPTPAVRGIRRLFQILGFGRRDLRADAKSSTRFHRLLRRGREYGTLVTPEKALAPNTDTGPHGIHFICLVANIARQFEFVQSAWIMNTKFDAMTDESDPLLGTREPVPGCPQTDIFSRPRQQGLCDRFTGLPRFVAVTGGAYFFLPSLSAIRYLAALGSKSGDCDARRRDRQPSAAGGEPS